MAKTKVKAVERKVELGIGSDNRELVVENLLKFLCDQHVLYVKTRNFHWNVQGMNFRSLHLFFEEQYNQLSTNIDDVAERIRSLGYFAPGKMTYYVKNARLEEAGNQDGDATKMLKILLADHEQMVKTLREDIETAEEHNSTGTADFLTALMEFHEKTAWMIRAHLA